ncbi:MAG TPA: hypothetical protein VNJ07_10970 [Chitinophagales bacterium]|nr:hypothetical protein [Chitinophagales bacterium]
MKNFLLIFFFSVPLLSFSQSPAPAEIPVKPFSYMPYKDYQPCNDTLRVLWFKKVVDIGMGLPEWMPVRSHNDNVVFEGTIIKTPATVEVNTHVSQVDMPLYHYTHDFTFNAIPDEHPDNRCRNLLCTIVEEKTEFGFTGTDTTEQEYMHLEWESGLAQSAKNNPCSELNRKGHSCGFFSAGHERRDTLWNWPTIGDWVHAEGLWIFDRGHPPADAEIHPIRFLAVRRQLPEKINHPEKTNQPIWATRLDIFANGDGGALYNNRPDKPSFAHSVKMGEKNYHLDVRSVLPAPSETAQLKFIEITRKGNTFNFPIQLNQVENERGEKVLSVHIPWKGHADTLVLAKTIYLYWNEGDGKPVNFKIHTYTVLLDEIHFKNRKEFFSRHEMRIFAEAGGQWLFVNDFFGKKDILNGGLGKSYRKRWKLDFSFTVNVPEGVEFRVFAGGWECDGFEERMGSLSDPYLPCSPATKKALNRKLNIVSPLRFKGCLSDMIGEVHDFYSPESLTVPLQTESLSKGDDYEDLCICNKDIQNGMMSLKYRIEKTDE